MAGTCSAAQGKGQRAAVQQNQDHGLPGCHHRFQELSLLGGQSDVHPVAAFEARDPDAHLLPFQLGG